jgi:Holliday junction resolvase RusA-like endonuclease
MSLTIAITDLIAIETWAFEATILGETASKANSRKLVRFGKRLASIKSDKARAYEKIFKEQAVPIAPLIGGDVLLYCHIFYASRRPDLDESLIMDLLQGVAYTNDRQVKAKVILHGLDKEQPRAVIKIAESGG